MGHTITPDWNWRTYMLNFVPSPGPQTAINISGLLEDTMKEWNIKGGQVGLISTDGASNMQAAVNHLKLACPWVHCGAHVIDLIVRQSMDQVPAIKNLVKKARNLARHFRV
jgi:alpha-acetolactate decarboxylase